MKDIFESNTPARKAVVKLTEGKIQKKCVDYARSKGFWARKFSSTAQRSVPDYLFGKLWPGFKGGEEHWAEEFKAPGKHSSDAQTEEQDKMVAAGWTVIRDTGTLGQADIDSFKQRIDDMERRYS